MQTFLVAAIALSLPLGIGAQPAVLRSEQREVLQTDSIRLAAVLRGDTAVLNRMLAPDWFLISGVTRQRLTRGQYLSGLLNRTRRLDSVAHDSLHVRVYGATAVLTGRTTAIVRQEGVASATTAWFTHVYVRDGPRWLMVSMHVSADR